MAGMTAAATPPLPSRFWADLSTRDFGRLRASGQAAQTVAVLRMSQPPLASHPAPSAWPPSLTG